MSLLVLLTGLVSLTSATLILSAGLSDGGELGALLLVLPVLLGGAFAWVRRLEGSHEDLRIEPTDQGFRLVWRRCVPVERALAVWASLCVGFVLASFVLLEKLEAIGFGGATMMIAGAFGLGLVRVYRGRLHTAMELVGHVVHVDGDKTVLHRPQRQVRFQRGVLGLGPLRLVLPDNEAGVVGAGLLERLHALPELEGSRAEVPTALLRE